MTLTEKRITGPDAENVELISVIDRYYSAKSTKVLVVKPRKKTPRHPETTTVVVQEAARVFPGHLRAGGKFVNPLRKGNCQVCGVEFETVIKWQRFCKAHAYVGKLQNQKRRDEAKKEREKERAKLRTATSTKPELTAQNPRPPSRQGTGLSPR